jgi:hypothetical protein
MVLEERSTVLLDWKIMVVQTATNGGMKAWKCSFLIILHFFHY